MINSKTIPVFTKGLLAMAVFTVITLYFVGTPISSFRWAGAPSASELETVLIKEWKETYPRLQLFAKGDFSSYSPRVKVRSAKIVGQSVQQARYGRRKNGAMVTYWPVRITFETTYVEQVDIGLNEVKEKEITRPTETTFNVFRGSQGWEVASLFDGLTDETPRYKFW